MRPDSLIFTTISTGTVGIGEPGYVTSMQPGEALSQPYVRTLLPRLARKAGIEKRVHAHGLRRTHASELVREGIDLATVQAQLGHAKVSTTAEYVRSISTERKALMAARTTSRDEPVEEVTAEDLREELRRLTECLALLEGKRSSRL